MLKSPTVASRTANFASTTKKANVRFSPALQLAAGESHTFDVYASLSGTDNENFSFKIIGVNVANGTASGTPISLGTLKTTSALSDEYDLKVKNNYTSLKAGDKNETIAQVEFTPQNDTAKLESFVLKFAYTNSSNRYYADEVFENVKVYDGDNVVGSAAVSKDKVIVSGLNISKDRKKTAKLTIKADVIHAGDDINYGFEVVADDTIVTKAGASYGLRENNVTTPATANGKVEGYGAEFKKVAISPKEYAPEKSDVVLYHATYKAATDTYIDDFQLKRSN